MRMFGFTKSNQKNIIFLCDRHLMGVHGEIHKHRHNFVKQHKIDGRFRDGDIQISPKNMQIEHDIAAEEIDRRAAIRGSGGHRSPFEQPSISYLPKWQQEIEVDNDMAIQKLILKCPNCKERYEKYG